MKFVSSREPKKSKLTKSLVTLVDPLTYLVCFIKNNFNCFFEIRNHIGKFLQLKPRSITFTLNQP